MSAARRLLLLLLAAALLPAAPLPAQAPELARVESLLDASRFTEARTALQRWLGEDRNATDPDDDAHSLLLRARLAMRADSALAILLELALGHPSSRYAPEALLRLGQGNTSLGQHGRAAAFLQRAHRDYPTFPRRQVVLLWLVRAQRATNQSAVACSTLGRAATTPAADPGTERLLQRERSACETPPAARPSAQPATAPDGRFTVQAGAFRSRAAALALAERLRARDIPARLVFVGNGTLTQVRAGRFSSRAAADPMLRRVRSLVRDAVVASDAHRERDASR